MMATFIFITFTSILFLVTASGSSQVLRDVHHVGCFPDTKVKANDLYEVRHLLTWEECLKICHHRLTKYGGVQAEDSSSTDNNCFCGNDQAGRPTSSVCRPCLDHSDQFCGGDHAMSVYRVRDATPFSLLIATDFGVKIYSEDHPSILSDVANTPGITGVKYLYDEEEVFFLSGVKIYRSFFDYVTKTYNNPGRISLHDYAVLDFTVDWVSKSILWMNGDNDYCIYRSDLQGGQVTKVLQRNYFLRNLLIDPYSRRLFFVEFENKLYSYSLDNGTLHNYYNGKIHVTKIKKMAVDVKSQLIYVIGSVDEGALQLMSVDYGDTKARQLYQGPQLTNPTALDVYDGEVVWVNHEDLTYSLYRCKLTPRCQPEQLNLAYRFLEKTNEINIYHPEKETPGVKFLCSQLGCSHSCDAVSLFVVKCSCPPDMTLDQDMATCQNAKLVSGNQQDSSIGWNPGSHNSDLLLNPIHQPLRDDEINPNLVNKRHLDDRLENSNAKQEIIPETDVKSKTDDSLVGHFQFFVVFCFFTLFLLISVVIYLQVRRSHEQERTVTVGHRCRIPEPEDGANTYVEILNMAGKIP